MKYAGSLKTVALQLVAQLADPASHGWTQVTEEEIWAATEEERLTHLLEDKLGVELFALTTSPEREALDEAFWRCYNATEPSDYGMRERKGTNYPLATVICWCLEILHLEAKKDGQREEPWRDDPDAWKG